MDSDTDPGLGRDMEGDSMPEWTGSCGRGPVCITPAASGKNIGTMERAAGWWTKREAQYISMPGECLRVRSRDLSLHKFLVHNLDFLQTCVSTPGTGSDTEFCSVKGILFRERVKVRPYRGWSGRRTCLALSAAHLLPGEGTTKSALLGIPSLAQILRVCQVPPHPFLFIQH